MNSTSDFELVAPLGAALHDYAAGDLFNTKAYLGLQTKYRSWHFTTPIASMGRRELGTKVCFRYGCLSDSWVLIVNGQIMAMMAGSAGNMVDGLIQIHFKLHDQTFLLKVARYIHYSGVKIQITLELNNFLLKEVRETPYIETGEPTPPPKVTVPSARSCLIEGEKVGCCCCCCCCCWCCCCCC
jgi:hypothetical protein